MQGEEFVYAVIPDHLGEDDNWGKILEKVAGAAGEKSHLEQAIRAAVDSKPSTGVDVVIVLSGNESVLDAASDLGAVSHMVPGFFDIDSMIRTYLTDPGVEIDPTDNPFILVIDPYSLEIGPARPMREIIQPDL